MCDADLVWYGAWPVYRVSDLGGLRRTITYVREAREHENGVTPLEGI